MKNFVQRKKVVLAGIGGAIVMLALIATALFFVPGGAFAATNPTSATPTAQAKKTNPYCNLYQQTLAKELNVSVDTLRQDKKDALKAVIAQKVKDGKLTQARATKLEQNIDKSQGNVCQVKTKNMDKLLIQKYRTDIRTEIAQKLQLQPAQLTAQLQSGKSLHDIASAKNISDSQLQTIVTTAIKDSLQKAVAAGDIKQQRANNINTFLQKHPKFVQQLINAHAKQTVKSNA